MGGGPNATPLYVATPTFYSHAHKDFSMFQWIFAYASIDRSRIGLLGFQRGPGLCRRGLEGVTFVGMALASKASYSQAQRSRPQGHAYKVLVPFEIPEGRFLIDRWMHMQKSTEIMPLWTHRGGGIFFQDSFLLRFYASLW